LYRREIEEHRISWYVRTGAFVVFAINTAFIALDYYAYAGHARKCLGTRWALNVAWAVSYARLSRSWPRLAERALCLAAGAMLLVVIYGSAGRTSDYYVGLALLLVGMPVLPPLTPVEAGVICAALFGCFIVSPSFALNHVQW